MSKVVAIMSMSLDGYVADLNDGVAEVFDWYMHSGEEFLIDQGNYVVTYGSGNTVERGKYLNVWKPEDGTRRIHTNIWNTSATPARVSDTLGAQPWQTESHPD